MPLSKPRNKTCRDWEGHGTITAGLAVADGGPGGNGIWGVAPQAALYSILVCTSSGCFADDIAAAINYLGDNNLVDVITMSIGGPSSDSRIAAAIDRHKGHILFVASSGNFGPGSGSIEYPAWDPNVIAVGAINSNERVTRFSGRGIDDGDDSVITIGEIELAAAGKIVESTYPTYFTDADGYAFFTGTSQAAPQVAGLAAKLWQGDPAGTRMHLRTTVTDITDGMRTKVGYDVASGYGLPHVGAVLTSIDVTPADRSIDKGGSQQYMAVGNFDDGSSMDITSGASWDSSDTSVATMNGTGLALGVEEGKALIAASMDGIASNDATLDVNAAPPVVSDTSHIGDLDGSIKVRRRGQWRAYVTVTVHGSTEELVRRAKVEATWTTSDGTEKAACRTRRDGTCRLRSPRFDSGTSDVTFEVTGISHKKLTYSAADNHDDDGDGTTLVVSKQ
ncbi:MAG: S8 family serine peptidase [Chloroflexi bacterium]|nr:S8 family serine peptidase [Chloroflexota bacterium]